MARGAALDLSTQEFDPRSHDNFKLGPAFGEIQEVGNRLQRGCKISIPKPDVVRSAVERGQYALSDRFPLSSVWLKIKYRELFGTSGAHRLQESKGSVRAAVVNQ